MHPYLTWILVFSRPVPEEWLLNLKNHLNGVTWNIYHYLWYILFKRSESDNWWTTWGCFFVLFFQQDVFVMWKNTHKFILQYNLFYNFHSWYTFILYISRFNNVWVSVSDCITVRLSVVSKNYSTLCKCPTNCFDTFLY